MSVKIQWILKRPAFFLFLAATWVAQLFFLSPASAADPVKQNYCISCHSDYWADMSKSVHTQENVTCEQCHGGDPSKAVKEEAKALGTGYIGVPDKKQIPGLCASCHSDVEKMNFYGVRTDQLARYQTSVHGKKLLKEGDTHVAACSDCHGYHDVLKVEDPNSPVYPLNVPKTCAHCHSNESLMKNYGLSAGIFDRYQHSVHGIALYQKKDTGVAQCASCHGGHGAVPPGVKEISATCGKCHINEKKYFLESPHAKLMNTAKFSECITCHSQHDVKKPGPELYGEACVRCHDTNGKEVQLGLKMSELFREAGQRYSNAEKGVHSSSISGLFMEDEEALLEKAKSNLIEMGPTQHTLDIPRIQKLHDKVISASDEIESSIHRKNTHLHWRKIVLVGIWIFVLLMIVALGLQLQTLKHHDSEGPVQMSRRKFLSIFIRGGLLTAVAGMVAPVLSYLWPVIRSGPGGGMTEVGKLDDFAEWGAKKTVVNGKALLIIRTPTGVKALSAVCTHLGCITDWDGANKKIVCPCHAGLFDPNGSVLGGPPPRPLENYPVKIVDGKILVEI